MLAAIALYGVASVGLRALGTSIEMLIVARAFRHGGVRWHVLARAIVRDIYSGAAPDGDYH